MPNAPDVFLFVGPTLGPIAREARLPAGVRLLPPVKRLDVAKVVARRRRPGVIAIVDGVFHEELAVGHAELREALDGGWQVWGLASMGAIRAREMSLLGMRGFGRVYARFAAEDDFQDDEVALLHASTPPWRAVTEPLVHLREALDALADEGVVRRADAAAVVSELKARWYGERTIAQTVLLLTRRGYDPAALRAKLQDFDCFRTKTADLERFLAEEPWRAVHSMRARSRKAPKNRPNRTFPFDHTTSYPRGEKTDGCQEDREEEGDSPNRPRRAG